MNNQQAVLFALLNSLLWGIAPVLFKKSYSKLSPIVGYVVDGVIGGSIIMLPYALFSGLVDFSNLHLSVLYTTIYSLTYIMFLYAFKLGKAGIVSVIIEINPVFTLIFGMLFFNQYLEIYKIFIILLILLLSIMLGAETEKTNITQVKKYLFKKWFLFSLLTAFLIGFGDNFLNRSVDLFNNYTTTLAIYLSQIMIILGIVLFRNTFIKREIKILYKKKRLFSPILLASICMNIGAVAFYIAFETGAAPLVSAVSGTSPLFTLLMSALMLKEKIRAKQVIIIIMILALVWGLS